jgi:hypothetical protein
MKRIMILCLVFLFAFVMISGCASTGGNTEVTPRNPNELLPEGEGGPENPNM